jgi:hypothetical protein
LARTTGRVPEGAGRAESFTSARRAAVPAAGRGR